jgi:predicted AAA+ superfamily ATPase
MAYKNRLVDKEIEERLGFSGALLIRGAKGCGKTFAAQHHAKSEVFVDTDSNVAGWMAADPTLLLRGETPRLLDEWQIYPELFNYVRREVDRRQGSGQFILTGSANPVLDAKIHSGVGRFSILKMRTMSRFELGFSTGQVSLRDLLNSEGNPDFKGMDERDYSVEEVVEQLIFGGWPGLLGKNLKSAIQFSRDYVGLTADTDISRADGVKRDAAKVLRLMRSFARNISTQTSVATMIEDVKGESELSENTALSYIAVLENLMIIEDLPAWNTHIRSSVALRTTPKRNFVDPSLAIGALALSVDDLLHDLNYTGYLFESSVIKDLRVYAEIIGAKVSFFRDAKGREMDAIVHQADGTWAGFEIKLGNRRIDDGAQSLLKIHDILDFDKVKKPSSLNVITSSGFPYRRKDGVNVIPISVLGCGQ